MRGHPGPSGGRFHSPQRGAWYAGVEIETSIAEVALHKRLFLAEGRIRGRNAFDYIDFQADFSGEFHTLDLAEQKECLRPNPVPQCYAPSQTLANKLLFEGSNGIVYPSVRHASGTCIACFRPALVFHPRREKKQTHNGSGYGNRGVRSDPRLALAPYFPADSAICKCMGIVRKLSAESVLTLEGTVKTGEPSYIDRNTLPALFPTHTHTSQFWEELGREYRRFSPL